MKTALFRKVSRKTGATSIESRKTPQSGCALGTPREEPRTFSAVSRRVFAPFALSVLLLTAGSVVVPAQVGTDLKNAGKDVGDATKTGAEKTKDGTVKAAKATKKGVKKGTNKAANETKKGADKVADKTDTSTKQ